MGKKKDWLQIMRALALLTQIGLIILANIGLGFGAGYLLDLYFETEVIFKVIGLLLGIMSGFYSNYKVIINMIEDKWKMTVWS